MHFSTTVAVLALAATTLAAPTPAKKTSFSVNQVPSGRFHRRNGAKQYAKAHRKFGAQVPTQVLAAAQSIDKDYSYGGSSYGSETATPEQYDQSYLGNVEIGTPAQTLSMDFDTGSSDLWVFSSETTSGASGHEIYTPSDSSTASQQQGETWSITYGDGSSSSGNVWSDTVVIGGVTATSQSVEAAETVSSEFASDTSNDGLVGLAWPSINTCTPNQCSTFMETVGSSLENNLFAAYLLDGQPGSYDFGATVSSHYSGSITYTSVDNSQGFWGITADGYGINGGGSDGTSFSAIVDTGTSLILLDANTISNYYAQVSGAQDSSSDGGWIFPCSSSLPSLDFYVAGVEYSVPGSRINYAPVDSTNCYGGLQSSANIGFNILGDVFINNFYVVFDVGNTQLGLAQQ